MSAEPRGISYPQSYSPSPANSYVFNICPVLERLGDVALRECAAAALRECVPFKCGAGFELIITMPLAASDIRV